MLCLLFFTFLLVQIVKVGDHRERKKIALFFFCSKEHLYVCFFAGKWRTHVI